MVAPNPNQLTVRVSKKKIDHEAVPTENPLGLDSPVTVGHVHADWSEDGTLVVTLFEPKGVDPALIEKGQKAIEIRTRDSNGTTTTVAAACCHFYHLANSFTASRIEATIDESKQLVLTLYE